MINASFHILLVDESVLFLASAMRCLVIEPWVACVACVRSCGEALSYIAQSQPDLVIVNVAIEGSSGIDCVRDIRAQAQSPLIALVAFDDHAEYHTAARDAGADVFMAQADLAHHIPRLLKMLHGHMAS